MDLSKFELGHIEIVLVKPSDVTSEKALSVRLVMSAEDASAYLAAHLTKDAPDRLPRPQIYDTGHPNPMFMPKESRTNGGG